MIPGLENVRFLKYGRMHRNTYLNSPGLLNSFYQINGSNIYIIGQLSGVDGYAPSISSGLVAATKIIYGDSLPVFPANTMIGGLAKYISNVNVFDFQPMCASYALLEGVSNNYFEISQKSIRRYQDTINIL